MPASELMLSIQDHWKRAGEIVNSILPDLSERILDSSFKSSEKKVIPYYYPEEPRIDFKIYNYPNEDCSGRCRLLEYENGVRKVEVDIFPRSSAISGRTRSEIVYT